MEPGEEVREHSWYLREQVPSSERAHRVQSSRVKGLLAPGAVVGALIRCPPKRSWWVEQPWVPPGLCFWGGRSEVLFQSHVSGLSCRHLLILTTCGKKTWPTRVMKACLECFRTWNQINVNLMQLWNESCRFFFSTVGLGAVSVHCSVSMRRWRSNSAEIVMFIYCND